MAHRLRRFSERSTLALVENGEDSDNSSETVRFVHAHDLGFVESTIVK